MIVYKIQVLALNAFIHIAHYKIIPLGTIKPINVQKRWVIAPLTFIIKLEQIKNKYWTKYNLGFNLIKKPMSGTWKTIEVGWL